MGFIANFISWLWRVFRSFAGRLVALHLVIIGGLSSAATVIGSMFSKFTLFTNIGNWLSSASDGISVFVAKMDDSAVAQFFLGWFAIDDLIEYSIELAVGTIGVTVAVIVTIFVGVFTIVPLVVGVRALMKFVQVGTGGFIDP